VARLECGHVFAHQNLMQCIETLPIDAVSWNCPLCSRQYPVIKYKFLSTHQKMDQIRKKLARTRVKVMRMVAEARRRAMEARFASIKAKRIIHEMATKVGRKYFTKMVHPVTKLVHLIPDPPRVAEWMTPGQRMIINDRRLLLGLPTE